MTTEILDNITWLQALRIESANYGKQLADRELEARLLRADIERRLREGTRDENGVIVVALTKTDAEKAAKADPQYTNFERRSSEIVHARAMTDAKAEAVRLRIVLGIAERQADFMIPANVRESEPAKSHYD